MNKINKFMRDPKARFDFLSSLGFYNKMDDKSFLRLKWRKEFQTELNLDDPKTFNEKLQWLKLHDRKNVYTVMVDKNEAKSYVAKIIGDEYVIPTFGVYDSFDEIRFDDLPDQFVIKCTHDSGGIVICKDKSDFDIKKAKETINKRLKRNFYYQGREWPYKNVKPRIIIEEYMGENLIDYRFHCFNGVAKYVFQYISESREDGLKPEPAHCNVYDMDWKRQKIHNSALPSKEKYPQPRSFKKMTHFSESLSKDCAFLRVDFYEINGKPYFGELTLFPGSGFAVFHPESWNRKLGDLIDLRMLKK